MMTAIGALLSKHSPILFGLVVGTAAKYGRILAEGKRPGKAHILGHLMMMGAVGLAATFAADSAHIDDPNARAFAAAVLAMAANDVIKYLASRGWKRFLQSDAAARGEKRNRVQADVSASRVRHDAEFRHPDAP